MRTLVMALLLAANASPVSVRDVVVDRMNRFNIDLKDWAEKYNRHVFDVEQAKRLSREWRDIEMCGEWPLAK